MRISSSLEARVMETSWPRPVSSIWARWHNPLYALDIGNFRMMAYSVPILQSARSGAWRPAVVYEIVQTWPNLTDFPSHRKQGGGFCSGGHLGSVAITGSKAMRRAPAMRAVRCGATGQPRNKKEHAQLLEAEHRFKGRLSGREALRPPHCQKRSLTRRETSKAREATKVAHPTKSSVRARRRSGFLRAAEPSAGSAGNLAPIP